MPACRTTARDREEPPEQPSTDGGFGVGVAGMLPVAGSRPKLADLLLWNEEMISQLQQERRGESGRAGFVAKMIRQHEEAATLLRAQLAASQHGRE